ncbi:MAG: hypothetical protein RIK87_14940 [Fuerstiella sp.]
MSVPDVQEADHKCPGTSGRSKPGVAKLLLHLLLLLWATTAVRVQAGDSEADKVAVAVSAGPTQETPLSPAAVQFIRGMALLLLPDTYTDDDDWGTETRIQSGLNVRMDGLKVQTSRRWKQVRHGTWRRVDASLISPEDHFQLQVSLLPRQDRGVPRYHVHASMRLRATVRQQRWNLGIKLYSISADVLADVTFDADLHFRSEVTRSEEGGKLRVLPHIERADVRLQGFSLRRISHLKGGPVREFGHTMDWMIERAVRKKGDKLADKVNIKVAKKPERFEIPAGVLAIFGESPNPPDPEVSATFGQSGG